MRIRPVGWSAVLLDDLGAAGVAGWHAELTRLRAAGAIRVIEIVAGEQSVLLDGVPDLESLAALLGPMAPPGPVPAAQGRLVELPTVYDGADLDRVAQLWRVPPHEVIRRHATTEFRVAFCGFAPGFGYLTGLPPELAVPRLDSPRPRVPPGSVGLAGRYCGVYPTASPGGWLLIGRTAQKLFDVNARPPAILTPGTRVRFADA